MIRNERNVPVVVITIIRWIVLLLCIAIVYFVIIKTIT